jgi:glycosyltransferase involved in cell wall biosynthesis
MKLVDRIVVPSGYLVDVFAKFNHKAYPVYNISDFSQFKSRSREQVQARIIVARNLDALYDVATSVRAFARVQEKMHGATLVIVGEGAEEKRLQRLVEELNLNGVTFTGRVERDRIAALFDEADIFLNSSVIDNMPVAIIEAFYAGLPVVTTNAGGIPYFVKDNVNGLVVDMRDDKALADSVIRLLGDSELRRRLIEAGRETAKQCSWAAVKMQWADAYRSVAGRDE